MEKDVCPGGVFHHQEQFHPPGLGPDHLSLEPLPACCEVPGDLVQIGLALEGHLVLKGGVAQHDGVVPGLQRPALVLDVVLVQPGDQVAVDLLPAVSYDNQLFQLLLDFGVCVMGQHPLTPYTQGRSPSSSTSSSFVSSCRSGMGPSQGGSFSARR